MSFMLRRKHHSTIKWVSGTTSDQKRTELWFGCLAAVASMLFVTADVSAQVVYKENFTFDSSGVLPLPAPWKSVRANQWLQGGWLHNQDQDGWPRDSAAVLHDSDPSWRDYELKATIDILGPWTHAALLLRSQGFSQASPEFVGQAYQLNFSDFGPIGPNFGPVNRVTLTRLDCTSDPCISTELGHAPLTLGARGPFEVVATLVGGQIQVSVDGSPALNFFDPNPITYGGIGIHNVWETHGRYDNFEVTIVPELSPIWLFGIGLAALLGVGRVRRAMLFGRP